MVDLVRTEIGSPFRPLDTRQRAARADNTYGVLSKLSALAGGTYQIAKREIDKDMVRKAKNDLVNDTINPDLQQQERAYATTVVKGQAVESFHNMKSRINSGEFDDMSPEDFQEFINTEHKNLTDQYQDSRYYDSAVSTYNDFWVENESTVTAGQAGRYRTNLKQKNVETLGKQLTTMYSAGTYTSDDIMDEILNPEYSMLSPEDRVDVAFYAGVLIAETGDDSLLDSLDEEFKFSMNPQYSEHFAVAKKKALREQRTLSERNQLEIVRTIQSLEDTGELNEKHFDVVDGLVTESGSPLYTPKQFNAAIERARVNRAKNTTKTISIKAFSRGIPIDVKPKEFNAIAQAQFDQELAKSNGDNIVAIEQMGRYLVNQHQEWSSLKDRFKVFSRTPMRINNEPNKNAIDEFKFMEALEKGMSDHRDSERLFSAYMGDAYPKYLTIKNAMKNTSGSVTDAWDSVANSLELQEKHKEKTETYSNLSKEAKDAGALAASEVYDSAIDNWVPDIIDRLYAGPTPSDRVKSVAAREYDKMQSQGWDSDVASQAARAKAYRQTRKWAGEMFDTRGNSMAAILGTNDPEGAWKTILQDPVWGAHLQEMFGEYVGSFFGPSDPSLYEGRAPITPEEIAVVEKQKAESEVYINPTEVIKELNLDEYTLDFRSPRDGGLSYSIPLRDIGAVHESKRHGVEELDNLERYYDDFFLGTKDGRKWYDTNSDKNDEFASKVLPNIDSVSPQEYVGMPHIEQTRLRKQHYQDNYSGVIGKARRIRDFFTMKKEVDLASLTPIKKGADTNEAVTPKESLSSMNVTIKADGPGKRNNNPGNLRASSLANGKKDGFSTFATPEIGFKALVRQVNLDAGRGDSIRKFISEYAPSSENNTERYINELTDILGVPDTTLLSDLDSTEVAKAVAKLESGTIVE